MRLATPAASHIGEAEDRFVVDLERVQGPLDLLLQLCKYTLLLFFIKIILIDMPIAATRGFLDAPYWAIADVKMLHFFTRMSTTSMVVIGILSLLSVIYRNFWCRYLCPYGALLGLLSMLSPFVFIPVTSH